MAVYADCELWLDGARVPDRALDVVTDKPTALSGLSLAWGRNDFTEQPDTASLSFELYDPVGDTDALEAVYVGQHVEVYATGTVPAGSGTTYYAQPDWSAQPPGPLDANLYHSLGVPVTATVVDVPSRTLELVGAGGAVVIVPPKPFDDADPAAWDTLPRIQPGQTWSVQLRTRLPPGAVGHIAARAYAAPRKNAVLAASAVTVTAPDIPGSLDPTLTDGTVTFTGASAAWLAIGVSVTLPSGRTWQDMAGAWTDHPEPWARYADAYLSGFQAWTPGDIVRRVTVFSGTVTDSVITASDMGGLSIAGTATDISSELANDYIGDEPWLKESVAQRVARIVGLSHAGVPVRIDPALQPVQVSWRDVDAQPVMGLLQDLAQTTGGVLWPVNHLTTGAYLWIEDVRDRAAVRELELSGDTVVIESSTDKPVYVMTACDILLNPIVLASTVKDVLTSVSVSWQEQTLDDDGQPAPTERTVTVRDAAALEAYGLRSMSVSTELTTNADATDIADRHLARSRSADWRVSGYTLDTALLDDAVSVPDTDRMAALMSLLDATTRVGLPLSVVDLPPWLPSTIAGVYVEGGTFEYDRGYWRLTLNITPGTSAGHSVAWNELDTTWKWDQFDPAISFVDLHGVGP